MNEFQLLQILLFEQGENFMFFFKKKPIEINCYAKTESVAKYSPIARAGKFLPTWWVNLAKSASDDERGMENCVGMIDLYSQGFMVPLWSDLNLNIGPKGSGEYKYQYADQLSGLETHAETQRGSFFPDYDNVHLKLVAPWFVECKEDVYFYFSQPTWNFSSLQDYCVLPGILSFKHQHSINSNLMFARQEVEKKISMRLGMPIAHIIPIDNRPIKLNIIADSNYYSKLLSIGGPLSFSNSYRKKKALYQAQQKKCPF